MSETELRPNGTEKPPRKRRGLRWFCIDLWWVHVIVLIVVVLCVTFPVVYVAYPKIAQHDVSESRLNITRMSITQPRPDGFVLNLTAKLESHSAFHPQLKEWNGNLNVAGASGTYLNLTIPAFQAKNGALTSIDRDVTLTQEQIGPFGDYVATMVRNTSLTSYLTGKGPLKLGGLPTVSVNYNKTLVMGGFDKLAGIELTDSKLVTNQPDNATLVGKVHIPNNSGSTVELGNLTFGLSLAPEVLHTDAPTAIGYATVNNTFLHPGVDNVFDIRSIADQITVVRALQGNATYQQTGVPITIVTRRVEYNGQEIPWLTQALSANPIIQHLNISEILANSQGGGS